MKTPIFSTLVLIFGMISTSFSQTPDIKPIKTDPRQFIEIRYRKQVRQGNFSKIWSWENRGILPDQKFIFLDIDGTVEIDFLLDSLIKNKYFVGNFSLEADITGADGTRKIEVSPYSEVGVNRERLGVESEPSYQLAHKLVNMLDELHEIGQIFSDLQYQDYNSRYGKTVVNYFKKIEKQKARIDSVAKVEKDIRIVKIEAIKLAELIDESGLVTYERVGGQLGSVLNIEQSKSPSEISNWVQEYFSRCRGAYIFNRQKYITEYTRALDFCKAKLGLILAYLNSFETNGNDATNAFFSLIDLDLISYAILKDKLESVNQKIPLIIIDQNDLDAHAASFFEHEQTIWQTVESLNNLYQFQGSEFENILQNELKNDPNGDLNGFSPDSLNYEDRRKYWSVAYNNLLV